MPGEDYDPDFDPSLFDYPDVPGVGPNSGAGDGGYIDQNGNFNYNVNVVDSLPPMPTPSYGDAGPNMFDFGYAPAGDSGPNMFDFNYPSAGGGGGSTAPNAATGGKNSLLKNLGNIGKLLAAALAKKGKGSATTGRSGTSTAVDNMLFPGGSQQGLQDFLGGLMEDYASPNHGIDIKAPHVSASHYQAAHAQAALIDMLDQAFEAEPNANLREDVYSRLRSGAQAGADDNIRKIMDSARSSGAGPNAPWVQQLSSEANKRANQESTQGLTDFFDSYVTAALGRRAAALGENAQLQTGVNTFNAGSDNAASAFNASSDNAASQANAQLGLQSQYYSASLGNQNLGNILNALQPVKTGSTTTFNNAGSASQGGNDIAAYTELINSILQSYAH